MSICTCIDDINGCPRHGYNAPENAQLRARIRELEEKLEEIANCDQGCSLCREGARIVARDRARALLNTESETK